MGEAHWGHARLPACDGRRPVRPADRSPDGSCGHARPGPGPARRGRGGPGDLGEPVRGRRLPDAPDGPRRRVPGRPPRRHRGGRRGRPSHRAGGGRGRAARHDPGGGSGGLGGRGRAAGGRAGGGGGRAGGAHRRRGGLRAGRRGRPAVVRRHRARAPGGRARVRARPARPLCGGRARPARRR